MKAILHAVTAPFVCLVSLPRSGVICMWDPRPAGGHTVGECGDAEHCFTRFEIPAARTLECLPHEADQLACSYLENEFDRHTAEGKYA